MLVHVAFAHESSEVLHSGEPTYDGEPVVVQVARVVHASSLYPRLVVVVDADGVEGFVHVSRLYNVYTDEADDGAIELASWSESQ